MCKAARCAADSVQNPPTAFIHRTVFKDPVRPPTVFWWALELLLWNGIRVSCALIPARCPWSTTKKSSQKASVDDPMVIPDYLCGVN